MKILVTGGTGFLGKNLLNYLKNKYKKKHLIIFSGRSLERCRIFNNQINLSYEYCDISKFGDVIDCISRVKPDLIINCAATKYNDLAEKFPFECIDTNLNGSINLFRAAKIFNVKNFISISTDKACPPHSSIYSMSKSIMEKALILENKKSKINLLCIRFGNLPWSTGSIFPLWLEMTKKNKLVKSTGPDMTRYFYSIDSACKLIDYAIQNIKKLNGKVIIPDMKSSKIKDILKVWSEIFKVKWIKVSTRKNDKNYESIISRNEYCKVIKIKTTLGLIYSIDLNENSKNQDINSRISKKYTLKEIKELILNKPKFL